MPVNDMNERIISSQSVNEEEGAENSLRPKSLDDFIGQERLRDNLGITMEAARGRGEALDHVLLYGPPGLGKTTLAHIIARDMGVNIRITAGPAVERPGDLAAILTSLQSNDVLFIDEIHRLGRTVEEILYPAMEDFALDIVIGKGPGAKNLRIKLPHFTLIGATTRYAMLSSPLRDRFGSVYRLEYYNDSEIESIIRRSARILDVKADDAGLREIACRARGTPRVANRLLKRVRDYAQVKENGSIDADIAGAALGRLEVDGVGLDSIDHHLLRTIIEKFSGGPVGLETLAAAISEDSDTIMDIYEPYLMQLGFLERTARGRVATRAAYDHLQIPYSVKNSSQASLI
ncbi:Holliday junction DNA helicase RuvB [Dehalogenimonas lykanthroporepellens BL-DC-9]|jgi:Holliday junction DNA helicase RuvB|nr:Holliday junction DNA helicase RuvB [Dehalogenimonas lykanthroporepellens BL-DC-9]